MLRQLGTKKLKPLVLGLLLAVFFVSVVPSTVLAMPVQVSGATRFAAITPCGEDTEDGSGGNGTAYTPSIDLGCTGKGNAIMDLAFAIIRFLSYGVGLVIVASLTYAGIQYIGSRGDPGATAQAIKRIQSNVTALVLFIFAFAILNYIVPGTLLK